VIAVSEDKIENILAEMLTERKLTISTAESCTGGELAKMITSVSGVQNISWAEWSPMPQKKNQNSECFQRNRRSVYRSQRTGSTEMAKAVRICLIQIFPFPQQELQVREKERTVKRWEQSFIPSE
jgi:hypothetical protein